MKTGWDDLEIRDKWIDTETIVYSKTKSYSYYEGVVRGRYRNVNGPGGTFGKPGANGTPGARSPLEPPMIRCHIRDLDPDPYL